MYLYTFKVCIVSWNSFVKCLYVDAGLRFALGATLAPHTTTPSMPEWVLPPQACYRARAVYVARLATFFHSSKRWDRPSANRRWTQGQ